MKYRNPISLSTHLFIFILFGSLLISCGNENDEKNDSIVKEEVEDAPIGLLGNVYRNQNYVFKISNLPVNEWSIFCVDYPEQKETINFMLYGDKDYVPDTSKRTNLGRDLLVMSPRKNISADDLRQMYEGNQEIHYLVMDIEEQIVTNFTSGEGVAKHYKIQKQDSFKFDEIEGIRTKDGFSGYRMDGHHVEDETIKVGYSFFVRSSNNSSRIYRFYYLSVVGDGEISEVKKIFDEVLSNLEFNIL